MSTPPRYCPNCKCSRCAGYRAGQRGKYHGAVNAKKCAFCRKPHTGKDALCAACAANHNARQSSRYHSRRAAKQCVDCGRDTGGPSRCRRCAKMRQTYKSRSPEYRKAIGDWGTYVPKAKRKPP